MNDGVTIIGIDPGLTRTGYAVLNCGSATPGRSSSKILGRGQDRSSSTTQNTFQNAPLSGGLKNASLKDVGVSATCKDDPQETRLLQHLEFFETLFDTIAKARLNMHANVYVAIERPFFTEHNPDTAFGTAQVSGLILALCAKYGFNVHLYTPPQVKLAVTGSGASKKTQIAGAVQKILKLESTPKPADASDAVAIGLTAVLNGDVQGALSKTLDDAHNNNLKASESASPYISPLGSSDTSVLALATTSNRALTLAQELWVSAQKSSGAKPKRTARKM